MVESKKTEPETVVKSASGPLTEGDMLSNVKKNPEPSSNMQRPTAPPPIQEPINGKMTEKRTWKEFRETKLLWWINRILHTFGWAIAVEMNTKGTIVDAYPIRTKFRGFSDKSETEGFIGISEYFAKESKRLIEETKS